MKRLILLLVFPFLLIADLESSFHEATTQYNQGNFELALDTFQSIDAMSPALDYNIGNSLMRLGRTSEAIAYYRRAQWQAPGDPDIQANLVRAVSELEAPAPKLPLLRSLTGWWTPSTWKTALMAGCWLVAGLGCVITFLPKVKSISFWVLPPAGLFLIVAALGTWASLPTHFMSEAVIKGQEGITRFEPLPDATQKTKLPGGSVVTVIEQDRDWLRIAFDADTGWIPSEDVIRL